ncbi:hypothetical protein [Streptomyces bicolor]|uniref:hypothetical protein n=1 Tax=Streptomyces bicolor TaxID=66874 RepID=UPI0004E21519|nr:hypothetical protein [Streptomyces bicolor]
MTGIGPVEPVNSPETNESHDTIGTDAPHLTDRIADLWAGLTPRTRTAAIATAVAGAVAAAATLIPQVSGDSESPAPVPWPANVTTWRYLGFAAPHNSGATSGRYHFAVTVDHGPPVTLRISGTAFPGLTAHALPEPAFTVAASTTRKITVRISVSDCSELPLNADLPFLDVTLRNTRAIQHHSFIFGGTFSRDLSVLLHGACDRAADGPGPRPSGSANSQHVDGVEIPPNRPTAPRALVRPPRRHNKNVTSELAAMPLSAYRA